MPLSSQPRVFISYARKDGATLAQRLQADLAEEGFDAWLDTQRIVGGATWTLKIEAALDEAEYVLALMTKGSYVSEICRAEQLRALRKDKCVIPLKAQSGTDIPLYLETKNYRDFSFESGYTGSFKLLLEDLHARNGIKLKEEFRETYVTAPPLPVNFIERPDEVAALRDALINDDGGRHIALTALQGMGGIGKTVLAQALCYDEVVQQAFPDGVIWITVGKESQFDAVTRMREIGKALGDDLSRYDNELGARNQYRTTMRKKAALVVVDDIWRATDIEPLRADSPRSRLLFTTRDASIAAAVGARKHIANLLSPQQSPEVFARWAGMDVTTLPAIAGDLIGECGGLPLALSMVGAMVCGQPPGLWRAVLDDLRNANLAKIQAQFPDYPYTDVLRAIQVSGESLDPTTRERYLALAVLLEEMPAAPQVQRCIWGADDNDAAQTAALLVNRSLAQRDGDSESIRLHDLQLDYVRAQFPDKEALDLIHRAIRLSSNVIEKDPGQFAAQMVGRLLPYQDSPAMAGFLKKIASGAPASWLRPLRASLRCPGDPKVFAPDRSAGFAPILAISSNGQRAVSTSREKLLRLSDLATGKEEYIHSGHDNHVTSVAITSDGKRAVSASFDTTLKVWDLGTRCELHTLRGHSDWVWMVALTSDGKRALSASADETVKIWELQEGKELATLRGHFGPVYAVAVTPDGQKAISASRDRTLRLWDLATARELRILKSHEDWVSAVGIAANGQRAVSVSEDLTLKLWDLVNGLVLRTFFGHSSYVNAVTFSADGRRAVSASADHTVKLWALETCTCLATFTCDSAARCCVYMDVLNLILAGDEYGQVHFLSLEEPRPKH